MKKAFTLVELLVVIGIIGVLVGVLLSTFGGSTESARAALCLSNLKNLANACQTYGAATGHYPLCQATEGKNMSIVNGRPQIIYVENKGWVSWNSKGHYPTGGSKSSQNNPVIGFCASDEEERKFALTNSCLWAYVARNTSTFVCPSHIKKCGKKKSPIWSYLMNGVGGISGRGFGSLDRADRYLLFSEIPFQSWHSWSPDGTGTGTEDDSTLQCSTSSGSQGAQSDGNETIGANHINGKNLFAHVAFADGHVEKLRIPYTGSIKNPQIDQGQLKNLTSWLCAGLDVSFDGKQYSRLEN